MKEVMHEAGFRHNVVDVDICGWTSYLTEPQIRALQVIARRKALESDEAFKEFTENVIVYKGRHKGRAKDKSSNIMHWTKNGKFKEEFDPGFWDTSDNLALMLFDLQEELH